MAAPSSVAESKAKFTVLGTSRANRWVSEIARSSWPVCARLLFIVALPKLPSSRKLPAGAFADGPQAVRAVRAVRAIKIAAVRGRDVRYFIRSLHHITIGP